MELRQALTAAALLALPALAAAQVERFAVVVGNDDGAPTELPLRWAEADASRVAGVLLDVGGIRPENLVLLRGQDAGTVRRALIAVNQRIREAGRETVLLVYYSGHADATALHLGPSPLELGELEQLVRGSAASFRLLVLDACRSGALTRVKGGTPIPPFELGLNLAERLPGEGAVFLTSSSASEDSQESDELRGSFFTHALVSGLLGAADANDDGDVTLEEAYRHAYEATVRSSSQSLAGVQHPTFRYDVRGHGDVVLASPGRGDPGRGWLDFPGGRTWLVFAGSADGAVMGEIGRHDKIRRLSLRKGTYFVRGRGADELLEGVVTASAGATTTVDPGRLGRTAYARLVRKGGPARSAYALELEGRARAPLHGLENAPCNGGAAGLSLALRHLTLSGRIGYCESRFSGVPRIETRETMLDVELAATHAWDLPRRFSLEAGALGGSVVVHKRFETTGSARPGSATGVQLAPLVTASRDLSGRTYAYLSAAAPVYFITVRDQDGQSTHLHRSFTLRFALGVGARL